MECVPKSETIKFVFDKIWNHLQPPPFSSSPQRAKRTNFISFWIDCSSSDSMENEINVAHISRTYDWHFLSFFVWKVYSFIMSTMSCVLHASITIVLPFSQFSIHRFHHKRRWKKPSNCFFFWKDGKKLPRCNNILLMNNFSHHFNSERCEYSIK